MNDTNLFLSTGHQGQFKKYLIAYFLGQMKCLLIDKVDTGRFFDSEVFHNGGCETKKHDMISPSRDFVKNKNEAWFLNKEAHIYNSRRKERERRERRDRRLISEKTKRGKSCKNKVTVSQFSKQPTLSREFIRQKNEAWFLNKEAHIYNSRWKERERRERRDRRLISEKTKRGKSCKNKVTVSQFSKQPTLSREFIRQKNEAWFKNKDQHIEKSRQHFRDKRDHRRATVQWNDAPAPSFLSRVGRLFGFGSHWTGEYHVGDHVRTGHYRMTKSGPVWVRSHGVRGHNKKR